MKMMHFKGSLKYRTKVLLNMQYKDKLNFKINKISGTVPKIETRSFASMS